MNKIKKQILFICAGNTCRSAMAEAIAKHYLKEFKLKKLKVTSAGLNASQNSAIESKALTALKTYDIPFFGHKPQQLTKQMCDESMFIITMSAEYKKALHDVPRVYAVSELASDKKDVSDPFGKSQEVYNATAEQLMVIVKEILDKIKKGEIK